VVFFVGGMTLPARNMRADQSSLTFPEILRKARARLLTMHFESGVGHIGGNLSALDILLYLHHYVLGPTDQFVLSKGHAAGALYTTLWSIGRLTDAELKQFHRDGTRLSGHPPVRRIPEILFATGSLGHGLSLSAGLALGKRHRSEAGRVFCLLSDGEWNEGSTWEALIFVVHQRLENLTLIVDHNRLQGFGTTKEVADLGSMAEKFAAFGLHVEEIDGHNAREIEAALTRPVAGPRVIVAHTRKGCGVSFMENRMEWHYLPMTPEQFRQALDEVNRT
jgi:transketolase